MVVVWYADDLCLFLFSQNSGVASANVHFVSRKKLLLAVNSESTEKLQKMANSFCSIKKRRRSEDNNNEKLENSPKKQKADRKVKKSINWKSEKLLHNVSDVLHSKYELDATSSKKNSDDLAKDQKFKQSSFDTGKHTSNKVACDDEIDDIFKVLEDQKFKKTSFETGKHASKKGACGDEIDDIFKVLEDQKFKKSSFETGKHA